MKSKLLFTFTSIFLSSFVAPLFVAAQQSLVTHWNFNSVVNDATTSTGSNLPVSGIGSISMVGGSTQTYATGYTGAVAPTETNTTDNSGFNTSGWPAQGTANKTHGIQVNVNTAGYGRIGLSFWQRLSNTAPNTWVLQYTLDHTGASTGGSAVWVDTTTFTFTPQPTSYHKYGFHFESYAPSIFTPVIRENIRQLESENRGHYTVYLPAYHDDFIVQTLMHFKAEWHVFSKYATCRYRVNNVWVNPIDADNFTDSLRTSEGVLCGAGFELPAEALFLNKKLMVIPMMGQYEQLCNAESLKKIGVLVLDNLCLLHRRTISLWLMQPQQIVVNYPNRTEQIIDTIFNDLTPFENASSTPQLADLVGV